MAEIGLVASIFGIAAFGAQVATTLYEKADILLHANQQIRDLAKHVTQFTAVLKHMGQVLETEKENCSKELLRDIKRIRHSCKRTFEEINSTVKSKRSHRFESVRWLFKRPKAMELESRLDSQQSMLQCIIHTLTVSKLGRMDTRSKEGSAHIYDLKEEIKLLKTFIMESYSNLTELRDAETSANIEAKEELILAGRSRHRRNSDNHRGSQLANGGGQLSLSSASKATDESSASEDEIDVEKAHNAASTAVEAGNPLNFQEIVKRPASIRGSSHRRTVENSLHRESDILLQMVPWRPRHSRDIPLGRLICEAPLSDGKAKSTAEGTTDSVRLLLDKWTVAGSAPVSNILKEELIQEEKIAASSKRTRHSSPQNSGRYRRPPRRDDSSEDDFEDMKKEVTYPPRGQRRPVPPLQSPTLDDHQPHHVHAPHPNIHVESREFWDPSPPSDGSSQSALGDEILSSLRSNRGGIYYTKSNLFNRVHFIDQKPLLNCVFVPSNMVPPNEWKPLYTELDRGLIRKEALDLLGYSYTETEGGKFSVSGDLEMIEIEELVKLSFQALERSSKEHSKAVIKERRLGEAIDALKRRTQRMDSLNRYDRPSNAASPPPPPRQDSWDHDSSPYGRYPESRPYQPHGRYPQYRPHQPNDKHPEYRPYQLYEPHDQHNDMKPMLRSPDEPHSQENGPRGPPPLIRPNVKSTSSSALIVRPRKVDFTKPTRTGVRFALPSADSNSSAITSDSNDTEDASMEMNNVRKIQLEDNIHEEREQLDVLRRKERAALDADDTAAADIINDTILDVQDRIANLVRQQREEEYSPLASSAVPASSTTKATPQRTDTKPPRTDENKQRHRHRHRHQRQPSQKPEKTTRAKKADDERKSQRPHRTRREKSPHVEWETESEYSDGDDVDSGDVDLYD